MQILDLEISDLKLLKLNAHRDERGYFVERFKKKEFSVLGVEFVQDNFSRSAPKVLRGLHYQFQPAQGKLVTCLSGKILDVAVDIRQASPSYGKSVAVTLDSEQPEWLWVPAGFAHGFCVLGDQPADVMYKVTCPYGPQGEGAILWNDSELNIPWPYQDVVMSGKDRQAQSFSAYKKNPVF
jgi:dTDP-4-dehydrorhamnose 3,5-epimerase